MFYHKATGTGQKSTGDTLARCDTLARSDTLARRHFDVLFLCNIKTFTLIRQRLICDSIKEKT